MPMSRWSRAQGSAPLLADVGDGSEQLAGLARIDDAAVRDLRDLGRLPAHPVEVLDGISTVSSAYRITLVNTARLRAIVVALACGAVSGVPRAGSASARPARHARAGPAGRRSYIQTSH